MILDVPNRSSLPFLDEEAIVEVPCVIGRGGIVPVAIGSVPMDAQGLILVGPGRGTGRDRGRAVRVPGDGDQGPRAPPAGPVGRRRGADPRRLPRRPAGPRRTVRRRLSGRARSFRCSTRAGSGRTASAISIIRFEIEVPDRTAELRIRFRWGPARTWGPSTRRTASTCRCSGRTGFGAPRRRRTPGQEIVIGETDATPGFLAGPITAGPWIARRRHRARSSTTGSRAGYLELAPRGERRRSGRRATAAVGRAMRRRRSRGVRRPAGGPRLVSRRPPFPHRPQRRRDHRRGSGPRRGRAGPGLPGDHGPQHDQPPSRESTPGRTGSPRSVAAR